MRCKTGTTEALFRGDTNETLLTEIDVVGNTDKPYSRTIGVISGPGSLIVKLNAKSGPGAFLVLETTISSR